MASAMPRPITSSSVTETPVNRKVLRTDSQNSDDPNASV
jgi:hypothetical protein